MFSLKCLARVVCWCFLICSLAFRFLQKAINSSGLTQIHSVHLLLAISCGMEGCYCRCLICHRLDWWMAAALMARVGVMGKGVVDFVWLFMEAKWTISHSFIFYCLLIIMADTLQQANGYEGTAFQRCSNNHCIQRPPTVLEEKLCSSNLGFYELQRAYNQDTLVALWRMSEICFLGHYLCMPVCLYISRFKVIKSNRNRNQQSVLWLEFLIKAGEHPSYWKCHCYWANCFFRSTTLQSFSAKCITYCQYQFVCHWLIWM